jgi:hypothetical protein
MKCYHGNGKQLHGKLGLAALQLGLCSACKYAGKHHPIATAVSPLSGQHRFSGLWGQHMTAA